jgi:ABC-type uncharacterized transport system permease subunit
VTLTVLEIGAYALASALYLGYLLGFRSQTGTLGGAPYPPAMDSPGQSPAPSTRNHADRAGRVVLAMGVLLAFVDIGVRCLHGQNPISSTPEAISFVSFMIALGYLAASLRYRLPAAGAFAVPAALVLLLLARVVPEESGAAAIGRLGHAHIFLATVGLAVFALAAVLAILYLFEDRQLKRKQFGRMLGRSTPLETLDRLALRCVSFGFPIFTVAIVTGAMWVARLGILSRRMALRPEYALAIAAWVAFGVLLIARVGGGWRGRRAAWLTLGGAGGALLVLVVYLLRHAA